MSYTEITMISESKEIESIDGAVEQRIYVNDRPRLANVSNNQHIDNRSLPGLQEFHKKSSAADLRSPSPCPGSRASSADSMPVSSQSAVQLKDDIIKEIQTEVMKPIQVMYSNILEEIRTLKLRSEIVRADVSCQTDFPGNKQLSAACNTNSVALGGPHSLSGSETPDFTAEDVENDMSTTTTVDKKPVPLLRKDDYNNRKTSTLPRTTQTSNKFRSNSSKTRGQIVQVRPRPKSEVNPTIVNTVDKRESLANALQFHIEDIVDGLAFNESDLLDCLVRERYLTEDEYTLVKKMSVRKDQIRALVSTIKGRDLHVLEGFVKHIKQRIPAVAEKFECNMGNGANGNTCGLCKLKTQFNVKHVVDSLWSIQVIDDGIYNQIISSVATVGAQSTLWVDIFNSLNSLNPENAKLAHAKLLKAVSEDHMLMHLEKDIKELLIKNNGKLICSCEPKFNLPNTDSVMLPTSGRSVLHNSSSTFSKNGRSNGSAPGCTKANISEEASIQTAPSAIISRGHDRKGSDNSLKPPPLPKRPSFAKNSATDDLTTKKPFNALEPSSLKDVSVPSSMSLPDRSPLNTSFKHSTKSKTSKEHNTASQTLLGPPTNDKKTMETHDETPSASGIPPLPVKKNKYSAWKRADEHGPSYV
ncbi:uncharacterized protein LOC128545943 [Mercenaria mercenaria]|uniref:uncharacterized protein LOC128545943 n=1 Tax=Mercenaria mercenaria TaxID=6596 RepID=UPI00234EF829|nr:uncharacterized protein LOC128545943 [Mercenaria mercenaria]